MPDLVFDHYTIRVADLDRSAKFYKQIIGLEEITNRTKKPHIRWFWMGNSELHLAEEADQVVETHVGVHMAMRVKDIEGFIDRLRSNNITIHDSKGTPNQKTTRADGVTQIYFKDPDAYWIEVNDAPME